MNLAVYIWLGLLVVFLIVEASCPIHLVSIWFAVGALAAMVAALFGTQIWLQITLFMIVSCVLVASLWPFIRKFLNPRLTKTNVDAVIGMQGRVIADIDNIAAVGQVKLGPMEWSARSTTGEPITQGTLIRVDRVEGVKVFVTPAEVSANL